MQTTSFIWFVWFLSEQETIRYHTNVYLCEQSLNTEPLLFHIGNTLQMRHRTGQYIC